MNRVYIIAQIVGFISFVLSLIAYHRKEKMQIFKTMMVANILDIIHYLLLEAYSGCITKVIALIRNKIIIDKEKNEKLNSRIIETIVVIGYICAGIITYKNIFSVLPMLAAIIYFLVSWNGNGLQVKKIAFYCYFLWLTYNICVLSISGIVSNCAGIISTFIAIKNDKRKEQLDL